MQLTEALSHEGDRMLRRLLGAAVFLGERKGCLSAYLIDESLEKPKEHIIA
ncbi:hypothetical protein GCM10027514_05580 [Azotobacter armeniacus]